MRRRLAVTSTLIALVLVLVLPATALGATYTYAVKKNTCSASGGSYGYGHMYFKVKLTERGNTPANKFTFAAVVQHRNLGSSNWSNESSYGTFTYNFPRNAATYYYTRWYQYDPNDFAYHRIKLTMKVWNGQQLLATKTIYGRSC